MRRPTSYQTQEVVCFHLPFSQMTGRCQVPGCDATVPGMSLFSRLQTNPLTNNLDPGQLFDASSGDTKLRLNKQLYL